MPFFRKKPGKPGEDAGKPAAPVSGELHVLVPVQVRPGPNAGEASVTVRSVEALDSLEASFTPQGQGKPAPVALSTADGGLTFEGVLRDLPAYSVGSIAVTGKTKGGRPASASEEFVMVRAERSRALSLYGPGGHLAVQLPAVHDQGSLLTGAPRREICIGPGGLDRMAPPDDMVLVGFPYSVFAADEADLAPPASMEVRLPATEKGLLDRRVNPKSLRLFLWEEQGSGWKEVASVLFDALFDMLTAAIPRSGTYAVFGELME